MSNFAFVYQALPELYQDCAKAEAYLITDAPTACFYARRAIHTYTLNHAASDSYFVPAQDFSVGTHFLSEVIAKTRIAKLSRIIRNQLSKAILCPR